MDVNDFLENPENQKYDINMGSLMVNILQYSIRNKVYLQYVLDKQIEIKEMLNGKTGSELADDVQFKIEEIEESIQKIVGEEYGDILDRIISKD